MVKVKVFKSSKLEIIEHSREHDKEIFFRGRRQSGLSSNYARFQSKWCTWALITQKWQHFPKFRKIQRLPPLFLKLADRAHSYEEQGRRILLPIKMLTYQLSEWGRMLIGIENWCVSQDLTKWQQRTYESAMSPVRYVAGARCRLPALSGRGKSGCLA